MLTGFCLYLSSVICAQSFRPPSYLATGAFSVTHADIFSFTANPATLARLPALAGGIYAARPYLLPAFQQLRAVAGIPAGAGAVGSELSYAGAPAYHEMQAGITYARSLGDKLEMGLRFNYHSTGFGSGYGRQSALSADAAVLVHLSRELHAGMVLINPGAWGYRYEGNGSLPSVYQFGLGYDASGQCHVSMALVKEARQPLQVRASLQYRFMRRCAVRAGMNTDNRECWLGIGLHLSGFRIHLSVHWLPQLGYTPGMMLLVGEGKENSE